MRYNSYKRSLVEKGVISMAVVGLVQRPLFRGMGSNYSVIIRSRLGFSPRGVSGVKLPANGFDATNAPSGDIEKR